MSKKAKKMIEMAKPIIEKHYNCLHWFICGLLVLIGGDISRWDFFCVWVTLLILIWYRLPVKDWGK